MEYKSPEDFLREDYARRETIKHWAFENNRFVMTLHIYNRLDVVCFTPEYDEIDSFANIYAVPIILNVDGTFHHRTWEEGPIKSEESHRCEFIRFRDVRFFDYQAPSKEQLDKLIDRTYQLCAEYKTNLDNQKES